MYSFPDDLWLCFIIDYIQTLVFYDLKDVVSLIFKKKYRINAFNGSVEM